MLKLEVAHRFCVKFAQGLPKMTRTDIALGMLGVSALETYIDMRKLNFLGILCRSNPVFIVKTLFMIRLFQYQCKTTKVHRGFIPDIVRILYKYSLYTYLTGFISSGYFPSKLSWKNICKSEIWGNEERQWKVRLNESNDFSRFHIVHNNLQPSVFWQIAYKRQNSRRVCHFMAKTISQKDTEEHCLNCGSYTDDSLLHSTLECRHAIPVHLRNDFGMPYKPTLTLIPSTLYLSCPKLTSSHSC